MTIKTKKLLAKVDYFGVKSGAELRITETLEGMDGLTVHVCRRLDKPSDLAHYYMYDFEVEEVIHERPTPEPVDTFLPIAWFVLTFATALIILLNI